MILIHHVFCSLAFLHKLGLIIEMHGCTDFENLYLIDFCSFPYRLHVFYDLCPFDVEEMILMLENQRDDGPSLELSM